MFQLVPFGSVLGVLNCSGPRSSQEETGGGTARGGSHVSHAV